ncbi:sensor histidine kinase [Rhizobium sp.]
MHLASLWRSTPFRLALTFAVLFVSAFLVAGIVTYQLFKQELLDNLDRSITELHTLVSSTYGGDDLEDLTATVSTYSRLASTRDHAFALVGPAGNLIAGNFTPSGAQTGITTESGVTLGLKYSGDYRLISGSVGANRLVIGQSFNETDRLEDIAFRIFIWATVGVVILAMAGGLLVAVRAQRRLDGIATAMTAVSHGELQTRVPIRGNNDDIDMVSRQINEALDRLSTLVETMRQVSSDIAHELKTPLNRLKMHIEDAVADDGSGRDVAQSLESARIEADQINATFEALLRISQIEAGARRTRFRQVDLADIVTTVAEIYDDVADDAGLVLVNQVKPGTQVPVHGERELLTQLLVNLVENAIRHCPAGTEVTLSVLVDEGKAVATVADNGPGIPREEREKVFRRLYRLDKSRTTAGSGLGLSLVRAIVDLHGGQARLNDNRPGLRADIVLPTL